MCRWLASPVQLTNCHPFRHGRWPWMHNGMISSYGKLKRDLLLAVDPSRFVDVEGCTDSELLFFCLTFGLDHDAPSAIARAVGLVEEIGRAHGEPFPMQGSVATTDGDVLYAVRYSSEGRSRSLFDGTDVSTLRHQYPDNPVLHRVSDHARLAVSEPLGDLRGAWCEVPEATCVTIRNGHEQLSALTPSVREPAGWGT